MKVPVGAGVGSGPYVPGVVADGQLGMTQQLGSLGSGWYVHVSSTFSYSGHLHVDIRCTFINADVDPVYKYKHISNDEN